MSRCAGDILFELSSLDTCEPAYVHFLNIDTSGIISPSGETFINEIYTIEPYNITYIGENSNNLIYITPSGFSISYIEPININIQYQENSVYDVKYLKEENNKVELICSQ